MLRRWTANTYLSLAWALSLGVSAVALAAPRDTSGPDVYRTSRASSAVRHGPAHGTSSAARRHARPKVLYRSGEHRIAQISPGILRRADPQLDAPAPHSCDTAASGGSCRDAGLRSTGLPDSLLQAPSPTTEQSLKQLGIPIVRDVYPIAILRPNMPDQDDSLAFERQ
jgi:hypothetical protein